MNKLIQQFDLSFQSQFHSVIGLDEVGRGALAGPIIAVAFEFQENISSFPPTLNDSKLLSQKTRLSLLPFLLNSVKQWGLGIVTQIEIDTINIQQANFLAFERALSFLNLHPQSLLLVDGNYHQWNYSKIQKINLIKGDKKSISIMAASILAKIIRDHFMENLATLYPDYGFGNHKGYGSMQHRQIIEQLGYSSLHRKSFKLKSKREVV